jgi:cytochrome P450
MSEYKYDLYSQTFSQHAYEIFARIRREGPVFQQPGIDGQTPIWYVSRFEDVEAMLKDDRYFALDFRQAADPDKDVPRFRQGPEIVEMVNNHLLTKEGDDHRRLRALVTKAFTPRRIADLRPRVQAIADELLDQAAAQKEMDLVSGYAFPLPITVIAELLGIPAADRDKFRGWSDTFVRPALTEQEMQAFVRMATEFVAYLQALFEERRGHPQDDLLSALLQVEEAGDRLSAPELFSMVVLLIVAGHETTVTMIGNATVTLLTHAETRAHLRQHPEEMPQAVEEFLRFDAPVNRTMTRIVAEDIEFGGCAMKRGDLIIGLIGSANRDEAQFPEAGRLEIERDNRAHLAFGRGVHYCLGAPLARLEGEIALNSLLRRLPGLRLRVPAAELEYREQTPLFHAYAHIPVAWD